MTKTITLTIDEAIHEKAKEVSKKVLGKQNVSGIFTYLINNYKEE